jgi:hypothetical protein
MSKRNTITELIRLLLESYFSSNRLNLRRKQLRYKQIIRPTKVTNAPIKRTQTTNENKLGYNLNAFEVEVKGLKFQQPKKVSIFLLIFIYSSQNLADCVCCQIKAFVKNLRYRITRTRRLVFFNYRFVFII